MTPGELKEPVHVDVDRLRPWTDIPKLKNTSGTGTYTTSHTLGVNGTEVPTVNQLNATADIGAYLHAGRNTLTVHVSTTLINRLRTLSDALSIRAAQANGLVGPVTLTPYSITRVS